MVAFILHLQEDKNTEISKSIYNGPQLKKWKLYQQVRSFGWLRDLHLGASLSQAMAMATTTATARAIDKVRATEGNR